MSLKLDAEDAKPYLKVQDGDVPNVCFADTAAQVVNAFKGENYMGGNRDQIAPGANGHMMFFGVEDFNATNAAAVASALKKSTVPFERLEIFGCTLTDEVQRALAEGFNPKEEGAKRIRRIDLDNSKLSQVGAKAIFDNVALLENVEHINLQGSLTDEAVKEMNTSFENLGGDCTLFETLHTMDFKINDLNDEAADAVAGIMGRFIIPKKPHEVGEDEVEKEVKFDLFYNNFKVKGAHCISAALQANCMVTHLDLSCNEIGDGGAETIANGIRRNEYIKTLKLALNNIGNVGAMKIMGAIAPIPLSEDDDRQNKDDEITQNKSIQYLDLSANNFKDETDPGGDAPKPMSDELKEKTKPENIVKAMMSDNPEGAQDIDDAIKQRNDPNEKREKTLVAQLAQVWMKKDPFKDDGSSQLKEFDFTGVEFSKANWAHMGSQFETTMQENITVEKEEDWVTKENTKKCVVKFSIVDLMNQENLEVLEPFIWKTGEIFKYENYPAIDWRRLPKKEAAPAQN